MTSPDSQLLADLAHCSACLRCLRALLAEDGTDDRSRVPALAVEPEPEGPDAPARPEERCPHGILLALRRITSRCAEARAAEAAAARAAHERIRAARARSKETCHGPTHS